MVTVDAGNNNNNTVITVLSILCSLSCVGDTINNRCDILSPCVVVFIVYTDDLLIMTGIYSVKNSNEENNAYI